MSGEDVEYEVDEGSEATDLSFNDSDYSFSENDDIIFEQNVSDNIELDARKDIVEADAGIDSESSDGPPSDELRSIHSDSEDELIYYPEFNPEKEMMQPEFELGKKFPSKHDFIAATKNFSINHRFEVKFPHSDKGRIEATCKEGKCPWRVWASKLSEEPTWQIKSFEPNHSCTRAWKNKCVSSKWLANRYIETFTISPDWDLKLLKATVLKEYGVEITKTVAWRARRYAKVLIRGSLVEQFGLLGSYVAEVRRTNPGTTIILSLDELVFKGIYVCFDACKRGFLAGCRPVICVDGCFLKGNFDGQLLSAVGIDGNDCIFPIAYAIIESENKVSWSWFLKLLGEDLNLENTFGVTFMSDRQKGLENIVSDLFPYAEHRFCVRHMYTNFFRKNHRGLTLRDFLWRAARSTYLSEFKYWMTKMEKEDEDAWKWLLEKPPGQWSKSHFLTVSKCDLLVNNLCESFNNYIGEARDKDILSLLQIIQNKLMVRMYKRREVMARTGGEICPKALKKLEKNMQESMSWKALYNGEMQYQVSGPYSDDHFVVDLRNRSCACRKWDLTGLPCPHAIATLREGGKDPLDFVDECYKIGTYLQAYQYSIYPINGRTMWPSSGSEWVKPPHWESEKRGRKRKKRRKGVEEPTLARDKRKKLEKKGDGKMRNKCSQCGEKGHNKRFHLKARPDAHSNSSQRGEQGGSGSCAFTGSCAELTSFSQPEYAPSATRAEQPIFYSQFGGMTTQNLPIPRTISKRKSYTPQQRGKAWKPRNSTGKIEETWKKMMKNSSSGAS